MHTHSTRTHAHTERPTLTPGNLVAKSDSALSERSVARWYSRSTDMAAVNAQCVCSRECADTLTELRESEHEHKIEQISSVRSLYSFI